MIPLPRPSLPPGACQECGATHTGDCTLFVGVSPEAKAEAIAALHRAWEKGLPEMERNREVAEDDGC